ncbi:uncharacterized protein LOC124344450 [Daphnia pulicaria]|uniref:uncharacterized protein LOC124344450 n=1 Tax=Daphnia pulicaria TaxID=35523 RepID=UPI001EEAED4C|nr:uncharacterized protein LOC124344450 [Daphnia pulicaria]
MSDLYPPYMCPSCDEWHHPLTVTEQCPNVQTHEGEEEINSDGEQNFDWEEDGVQQNWDEETEDFDHHYGDEIVDFSDDDGLEDLEVSFSSTMDLDGTMDEEINSDLVKEDEHKRKRMSDGDSPQFKRPKQYYVY